MSLLRFALLAFTLLLPTPSFAEGYSPGDACTASGALHTKNDAAGASHLVCNGSTWQLSTSFAITGAVGVRTANPSSAGSRPLELDVEGDVGAEYYCDKDGNSCVSAASLGSGGTIAAGADRSIQFNNASALGAASTFVYTSAGRVGIGTGAPTYGLHVAPTGGVTTSQTVFVQDATAASGITRVLIKGGDGQASNALLRAETASGSRLFEVSLNGTNIDDSFGRGVTLIPGPYISYTAQGSASATFAKHVFNAAGNLTATTGTPGVVEATASFAPTSGTAVFDAVRVPVTVNQTGGASGITRGIYVNPTLTAAADWRSIETSNNTGFAVYAAGSAASYFGGLVGIGSSTPAATLHVNAASSGSVGAIVRGAASQTANLQEWKSSAGTSVAVFSSAGWLGVGDDTPDVALDVVGDINYTGAVADVSDRRAKENVTPLPAGQLGKVVTLEPVSFTMKGDDRPELGFIAQDVEPLYPELVRPTEGGLKTLNSIGLIAPLVAAVKEQQAEIDALRDENRALEQRLKALEGR